MGNGHSHDHHNGGHAVTSALRDVRSVSTAGSRHDAISKEEMEIRFSQLVVGCSYASHTRLSACMYIVACEGKSV